MEPPQMRRVGNLIISILDFLLSFIEASSIEAGVGRGMGIRKTEAGGETYTLSRIWKLRRIMLLFMFLMIDIYQIHKLHQVI